MIFVLLAFFALVIIIGTTLKVENLKMKTLVFAGLGAATAGGLLFNAQGLDQAKKDALLHIVHHTYVVDYLQFIPIAAVTVLIAALGLFKMRISEDGPLGFFLLVVVPVIGNFATTWAIVPIGLSLVPILQQRYPERWKFILVAVCVFGMNLLALATLAADPPQALLAVKAALMGIPLGFFFPFEQFWVYLCFTWFLYFVMLRRLGIPLENPLSIVKREVQSGSEQFRLRLTIAPESWPKFITGCLIALALALSITKLKGYEITFALGSIIVLGVICAFSMRKAFTKHERHDTIHWLVEVFMVFIAFFSVVALAHTAIHGVEVANSTMIYSVIGMTVTADNAAAFAAGFPQYVTTAADGTVAFMWQEMTWFNLFNSVVYGAISPLGNGPQITLFLVIFVAMKVMTPGEVFKVWIAEARVFLPYLAIWTLSSYITIEVFEMEFATSLQLLTGFIALAVAKANMLIQSEFLRKKPTEPWDLK